MNQKTLLGLAVAAIVAIVAAVVVHTVNRPRSEGAGDASSWLAPSLRDHVNDVGKVVVTTADAKAAATLERGANGWAVAEKGGYPADTGKLRALLLALADARLVEQKTSNKDKYATLGVEDVASKDAKGVQLELDGITPPLRVIVGIANQRGGGSFVRRVDEAQSWLVSSTLTVEKTAADWLRKDLIDIAAARVAAVTLTRAGGAPVRIAKNAASDANFALADIPKGREAGSEFTINGIAATLAGLRFDDVVASKDAAPEPNALKARFATFDGVIVDITAWEKDGKSYALFAATADTAQAERNIATTQAKAKSDFESQTAAAGAATKDSSAKNSDAADAPIKPASVGDPAADRSERLAALNRDVAELNSRFEGWTYVLPPYKFASINKSLDDLLKPPADKKADAGKGSKGPTAKPMPAAQDE